MDWKTEEYPSDEGGGKIGWIWSKGVSLGKKVLAAGIVVSSAPLVVPPLVVVSTIAVISSVPYCMFLASYACTQKLMNALLPGPAFDGGTGKDELGFGEDVMEDDKLGQVDVYGEGITGVDEAEPLMAVDEPSPGEVDPVLIQIEGEEVVVENIGEEPTVKVTDRVVAVYERPGVENEEMEKETKNLIESIRDEGRTEEVHDRTLEKAFQEDKKSVVSSDVSDADTRSEKVGTGVKDLPEKKEAHETRSVDDKEEADKRKLDRHEGELESTVTETSTSTEKDEEMAPDEPVDRAVGAPRGTGEEKRKNSNKKKRKTGRAGGGGGGVQ